MNKPILVKSSAGQEVEVKIYGDVYTVELDKNNKAELTLYGQKHLVIGQKPKKVQKPVEEDEPTEV